MTERKNILALHSSADLYGSDRSLLRLVAGSAHMFSWRVALPYEGPLGELLRNAGANVEIVPLAVIRRQYFNPRGVLHLARTYCASLAWLQSEHRRQPVDILYSNTSAVISCGQMAQRLRIPSIQHVRETIVRPRPAAFFLSFSARSATRIVCVSEACRRNFIRHYPPLAQRCEVIHNGIEVERFMTGNRDRVRAELKLAASDFLVVVTGRISAIKGLEVIRQAIERLATDTSETRICLAIAGNAFQGQEWREEALRGELAASPARDCMQYLGLRQDIPDLLAAADVICLPSVQPDSFPTSVLEGMAAGKPVVATRLGGAAEMIEDGRTGYLVPPGDVDALARALRRIAREPDAHHVMGREAQAACVRRFSSARYLTDMIACFETTLAAVSPSHAL